MAHSVILIAAIDRNRALGRDGDLLWKIPDDLKRFRELTAKHPVIMGRKTWESLPEQVRPMPGRTNIVITRQAGYSAPGALIVPSVESALEIAKDAPGGGQIFIIGGGEIYTLSLPYATRLDLTIIDAEKDGDAHFPAYEDSFTKIVFEEAREWEGLRYRWIDLER